MEDGEEEDGDEDAQLVDGDDHAGGAVLDRPVITAQTAAQEARMKPSSPRGTAQTSRSFPVTATIAQAITRTTPVRIAVPRLCQAPGFVEAGLSGADGCRL